jgi:16S rRNA (cytidine1402-2'-O)-methyltransferase
VTGKLVLVATPIGNLGDMTVRAVEVLKSADVIACEDTRHTRKLLNHFEISGVAVMAVHEHNEAAQAEAIVERIHQGEMVALVTDAGMPGISDPGERVVAAVAAAGLEVSATPGASAGITALAISGLPTERFVFEGFLPRKGSERTVRLQALVAEMRTTVFYESPSRVLATAQALRDVCGGERRIAFVRELTKLYEEVWRGTLDGLIAHLDGTTVKGECVLVLAGAGAGEIVDVGDDVIRERLDGALASGLTKRDAITKIAADLNLPKNRVSAIAFSTAP